MSNTNLYLFTALSPLVGQATPEVSHLVVLDAFGPLATSGADVSLFTPLVARASVVATEVYQLPVLIAYGTGEPFDSRQQGWTFTLDGHKFYVLPLGPEGDWAYDVTTQSWCQLQTNGFNGLNFTKGVMWGPRIIGGDALFPYLYELDPNTKNDEGWRDITHVVTGGIPLRGRYNVGVSNFTITASVAHLDSIGEDMTLNFSDDNGNSWSPDFNITLNGTGSQRLIWNSLGSFSAPGRVFKITDTAGPVRIDGADVVLKGSDGADSGESQE